MVSITKFLTSSVDDVVSMPITFERNDALFVDSLNQQLDHMHGKKNVPFLESGNIKSINISNRYSILSMGS